MSAAHQFAISHVFVHKGKKVTGCDSGLQAGGLHYDCMSLQGLVPMLCFFLKGLFIHESVENGMLQVE